MISLYNLHIHNSATALYVQAVPVAWHISTVCIQGMPDFADVIGGLYEVALFHILPVKYTVNLATVIRLEAGTDIKHSLSVSL